ncbi:MAG: dTMP kinase [Legionellales bacterium]|nr:dTMP kinase [Legionellales bacterium]|tara:strand:- start:2286 stop:2918 length:633 start_codon:yes stop_codon:yes gene_type:complete
MTKAKFITIEGIEGVGKSTAVENIAATLTDGGIDFITTREPGGTEIAEKIRHLVLLEQHNEPMHMDAELLLMFASRAQHLQRVIKPALARGQWVLCDRFTDASFAYQGGGRNIDMARIAALEDWVQQGLQPDFTLLLDAAPEVGQSRASERSAPDRIEAEKLDFFARVRQTYLDRAELYPQRFHIVNAEQSLEAVTMDIRRLIEAFIGGQ